MGISFLEVSGESWCTTTVENCSLGLWMPLIHSLKETPWITTDSYLDLIPIEILYDEKDTDVALGMSLAARKLTNWTSF